MNGKIFTLEDVKNNPGQVLELIKQGYKLEGAQGCSSCGKGLGEIRSLVACDKGSVAPGDSITITATVSTGTPNFNIVFYKMAPGSTTKETILTDASVPLGTYPHTYIVPTSDIAGDWTYGIDIADSCPATSGGPKTCYSTCTITVTPVCAPSQCEFTVT